MSDERHQTGDSVQLIALLRCAACIAGNSYLEGKVKGIIRRASTGTEGSLTDES